MQKFAQKRSILNKLREKTNIGGIAAEKFFNPEFQRVMDALREADNKIRAIASGTDIEGEDAGTDPVALKDLLKSAKSNINRREYMTALAFLGRFHKKVETISKFIQQLGFDVDKVHHDFLFKDLDEDQKKHLHEMKSRFAASQPQLVSEAGIMDFFANVGTERGRALAAWEKRYPKQVKQIKKDIISLYAKSESVLSNVLSALKAMATARATRKIDDYMSVANKIVSHFHNYDRQFRDYYGGSIKSFLEKQELNSPTKSVNDGAKELNNQDIDVEVGSSIPPSTAPSTDPDPATVALPSSDTVFPLVQKPTPHTPAPEGRPLAVEDLYKQISTPGKTPAPATPTMRSNEIPPLTQVPSVQEEELEDTSPDIIKEPAIHSETPPPKAAHRRFMESLVSLANEDPTFLAAHISRYARTIQSSDPDTAIQLLNLVKTIKQG